MNTFISDSIATCLMRGSASFTSATTTFSGEISFRCRVTPFVGFSRMIST